MLDRGKLALALAATGVLSFALAGCPKNVPQDSKSGEDAKYKGAKTITLENDEGRARGIVTYPGGDRVDWKVLELPKDKVGSVRFRLKWDPPRPGLDLSFEVFNEWFHSVGEAKPNKRKKSRRTLKTVTVPNAKGKYYVMIYASERGDAGKYTLRVEFTEEAVADDFDWLKVTSISDPPKLPAVPEAPKPCDPAAFDKKNPACASVCPTPFDPQWPACSGKCPNPPDANIPACLDTMPCPNPPDRKFKMCKPSDFPPCPPPTFNDKNNPNCDNYRPPDVIAPITDVTEVSGGVLVTIAAGLENGIEKGWEGVLLDSNNAPVRGATFVVQKVTKFTAVAKIKVSRSKVATNAKVKLSKP